LPSSLNYFGTYEVNLKPTQWGGSPSMKIHEIHPWHTIYNIISSMMFGLFTIKNHPYSMDEPA
jgi:hypothetical protein